MQSEAAHGHLDKFPNQMRSREPAPRSGIPFSTAGLSFPTHKQWPSRNPTFTPPYGPPAMNCAAAWLPGCGHVGAANSVCPERAGAGVPVCGSIPVRHRVGPAGPKTFGRTCGRNFGEIVGAGTGGAAAQLGDDPGGRGGRGRPQPAHGGGGQRQTNWSDKASCAG